MQVFEGARQSIAVSSELLEWSTSSVAETGCEFQFSDIDVLNVAEGHDALVMGFDEEY